MTIAAGLEGIRASMLEAGYGDRVAQARVLREHWLSVHSALDEGGAIVIERSSFLYFDEGSPLILWRRLDPADRLDAKLVDVYLENESGTLVPERLDCVVGYLDGSQELQFALHASVLLAPYEEPQP